MDNKPKLSTAELRELYEAECDKLDPVEEKAFAEEGMALELARWPEY